MNKTQKSKIFSTERIMPRFFGLVVVFVFLGIAITTKAAFLMFGEKHDWWMKVNELSKQTNLTIPAKRGTIYSADGQVLSATLPEYRLFMDFMSWEKDSVKRINDQMERDRRLYLKIDSLSESIHQLFPDIDPTEFKAHMLKGREACSHHWPVYSPRITYVDLCKAEQLPLFNLNNSGLHTEKYDRRRNPFGELAHATIGIYDEERDSLKTGLESSYDSLLRGTPGVSHIEKVLNRRVRIVDKPAVDGYDIVTTIDVRMQDLVEETLRAKLEELEATVGMCVLMEVATGDVKAISSLSRRSDGNYYEVDNRALYSRREPGSVFKPMAFMVAFEDGKIDLNSGFNVGGGVREMYKRKMRDSDWRSGGKNRWISAVECIKYSSNVGVSALIDDAYHNDPEAFVAGLDRIGVRTDLKLPLKDYLPPSIRYPQKDAHGHWTNWWETALPWMSIGYETQMPPIQTLTFYNAVANGGKMVKPRFLTCAKQGNEIVRRYPVEYIHADRPDTMMCSKEALRKVKVCLEAVVGKSDCTGKDVYTPNFPIAGKTGTAQIWDNTGKTGSFIISFAGYFPANAPRYSMIVCIEKAGTAYGGAMCGPVFKKIAEVIWAQDTRAQLSKARDEDDSHENAPAICNGNIQATSNVLNTLHVQHSTEGTAGNGISWGRESSDDPHSTLLTAVEVPKGTMPDLTGYGLRDVVFRMESLGLKVKTRGYGHVTEQSIAAGHAIKAGQTVTVTLAPKTRSKKRAKTQTPTPAAATAPHDSAQKAVTHT